MSTTSEKQVRVPYGQVQGYVDGIPAYSNGNDNHFSGHRNIEDGHVFTGFRWQCVEFGRRWLLVRKGLLLGDAMFAAHIFEFTEVEDVATGEAVPMTAVKNGQFDRPVADSFIIYPQTEEAPVGHIAVITGVFDDHITIADQNQHFHKWESNYSAKLPLRVEEVDVVGEDGTTTKKTRYTIVNEFDSENPLGWLTFPAKYDNCRPDPNAHLTWHPSYKPADFVDCSMTKLNACASKSVCNSLDGPQIYSCPASSQTTRQIFDNILSTVLNKELGEDDGEGVCRSQDALKAAWKAFHAYYFSKTTNSSASPNLEETSPGRGDAKRVDDALFVFSGLVERHLIEDGAPGKKGSGGNVVVAANTTTTDDVDVCASGKDISSSDEASQPLSPTMFASTPCQVVPLVLGEVMDGLVDTPYFTSETESQQNKIERKVDNRLSFFHTNMEGLLCTNRAANTLHQIFLAATAAVLEDDEKLRDISAAVAPTADTIASGDDGPSNFAEIPEELWPLLRKSFADTQTNAFRGHNLTTLFAGYFELTIASRTTSIPAPVDPTDNAYGKKGFLQLQGGRYFLDSPEGVFELAALHNVFYDDVLLEAGKQRQTSMRYIKNHKKKAKKTAAAIASAATPEGEDDDEEGAEGDEGVTTGLHDNIAGMKEFGDKGKERSKRRQQQRQLEREQQAADGIVEPASPVSPTGDTTEGGEPEGMLMSGTTFLGKAMIRAWRESMKANHLLYNGVPLPPSPTAKDPLIKPAEESARPLVHIFVGSETEGEVYYRSLFVAACAVEAGGRAKVYRSLSDFSIVSNSDASQKKIIDKDGEDVRILWKACRWDDALRDYALWKSEEGGSTTNNTTTPTPAPITIPAAPRLCELLLGAGGCFGVPTAADVVSLAASNRASAAGVFVVDPLWVCATSRSAMFKYAYQVDPTHFAFQGIDPHTGYSTLEGSPLLTPGEVNGVLQCWVVAGEAGGVTGCEKKVIPRSLDEMRDMGLPEEGEEDATTMSSTTLGIGAVKTQRVMYPMRFVHD